MGGRKQSRNGFAHGGLRFVLLMLLFWSPLALAVGGKIKVASDFSDAIPLAGHMFILTDPQNTLSFEDVRSGRYNADFQPFGDQAKTLGWNDYTYWLAFEIHYKAKDFATPHEIFIKNSYALLDEIDVFVIRERPDPVKLQKIQNPLNREQNIDPYLETFILGEMRPFENNRFAFPRPIAGVEFVESETVQVFLRIRSSGSKILQFNLLSEPSMLSYLVSEGAFITSFYGIMFAMTIYNLFVFVAVRERSYFYYVLAITFLTLAQFGLDALPWALGVFDDPFWTNQFLPISICVCWLFLIAFARSFLNTRENAPILDYSLKIIGLFFGYWALLSPVADYNTLTRTAGQSTVFVCLYVSFIGAYVWMKGYKAARYYMMAWLVYVIGVGTFLLSTLGIVEVGWVSVHSPQLGAIGNVILLSLALADNINSQKRAMERARRTAVIAQMETESANERAQKSLQRFRQIWANAREGIFQCTMDGRFISANPTLARILGYESGDELVEAVTDIAHQLYVNPDERRRFEDELENQGRVRDHESLLIRKDGSYIWSNSSARLVTTNNGQVRYIEGTVVDISERMEKEKALRAREAAEASTAAKSEFLANMSHEIRTPMNAIIGFTDLALRSGLKPKQHDYLSKINTSAKNLLGIINDILDFSKIEAGRMELESTSFELASVARNIADLFTEKSAQKGLELVVHVAPDAPRHLVGDPLRLGQVLINLVGNAVKFTHEGEVALLIEASSTNQSAEDGQQRCALTFRVCDTGIGIPVDKQKDLFSPFTQVDGGTTRKFGGTGLGLSITSQIVELMGGTIEVDSKPGWGSQFFFTVEFPVEEAVLEEATPFEAIGKGQRILLIDEPDHGSRLIRQQFELLGCECEEMIPEFDWESQLRAHLDRHRYDAVFVDRSLKAASTRDIAACVADCQSDRPVIIAALSGEEHYEALAKECGYSILRKPVDEVACVRALAHALGLRVPQLPTHSQAESGGGIPDFSRYRVLLVEDTYFNQQLAIEYLDEVGVTPDLAQNGEEAVACVQENPYDLVLMDCQMPVVDGYEATRRIRRMRGKEHLPIIAMTANAMKGDREKCLHAGMTDYVSKPIDPDLMYQAMRKALEHKGEADRSEAGKPNPEAEDTLIAESRVEDARVEDLSELSQAVSKEWVESCLSNLDAGDAGRCLNQLAALRARTSQLGLPELTETLDQALSALSDGATAPIEPLLYRLENQINEYQESQAS